MPGPAAVLQVLVTANTAQANAALAKTQAQLTATAATAEKSAAKSSAAMSGFNKGIASLARYGPMALGAFAVASVKMGADFEDAMSQVQTQAGATRKEVEKLTPAIIDLAKHSEFGPTELAKGLFRVESAGIRGARAMKILKAATDLADVGHADLEQTTRAYVAAIKSGIKGTENFSKAAGLMNAIVGQGSMRMNDLVSAFGTGLLPRAKAVGLSLSDVGAALGVLTEQGFGATQSATRLGMTLSFAVRKPTAEAADALRTLGIRQGEMANLLQQPHGLLQVLSLLKTRLEDVPKAQRAAMIGSIFGGGRSSAAIQTLLNSLDDYTAKLHAVKKSQGDFSAAIKRDNETMSSKVAASWAFLQAEMTQFGMHVNKVANFIMNLIGVFRKAGESSAVLRAAWAGVMQTAKQFANPIGTLTDALQKLGVVFGKVKSAAVSSFNAIKAPVVSAGKAIVAVLAKIVRVVAAVINAFNDLKGAPGDVLGKGVGALGDLAGHIPGLQKGGRLVGGRGTGDIVPAMLEPGEVVLNRKAVAAMGGARRANSVNKMVPRFASGGAVAGGVRQAGRAGTGLAADAGVSLLRFLAKKMGGAGNVQSLLKEAQRMSARHEPYLWGGGHAGFSRNGPWDCSGAVSQLLHGAGVPISSPMVSGAFMQYGLPGAGNATIFANPEHVFASIGGRGYGTSAENPGGGFGGPLSYNSRPGFAKRHPDMAHVSGRTGQAAARGFQHGGIVEKLAAGGIIAPMEHGKRWIKGGKHGHYNASQAATLAWQVGAAEAAAKLLSTKVQGESGGNSRAISSDHGYGLWQITAPYQNRLISKYGGVGGVMIPPNNAAAATSVLGSEGIGAWYAPSSAAGSILKSAVGTRGLPPKPKTKKKVPKGSDPGGAGEPPWSLALPSALTNIISSLGGDGGRIAEAADFASRAASFGLPVGGKDEMGWILEQLKLMEQLREAYIAMILWIQTVIDRFQEAIATAKDQIANLRQGWGGLSPKQRKKRLEKITELKAKIGKWTGRRDISTGALTGEEGPQVGLGTLQDPVANKAFQYAVGLNLADKGLWGVFGGPIADAQESLKSAREALSESGTNSDATDTSAANAPDNSALIALLQQQANNLAQQLYVSQQSYAVLASTPYAGSFAKGGVVPGPLGAPRLATVHGGESIGQPQPIVIVVQDGAVNPNYIRAIFGKQAEQMARRAGRGRIPGRAGSMT